MSESDIILISIQTLISDFMHKYDERPRFIKVPLWVERKLKDYAKELLTNFNYSELEEKEDFTVFGLKMCSTITICEINEMEVF